MKLTKMARTAKKIPKKNVIPTVKSKIQKTMLIRERTRLVQTATCKKGPPLVQQVLSGWTETNIRYIQCRFFKTFHCIFRLTT